MSVQQLRAPVMAGEIVAVARAFEQVREIPVGSLGRDELPEVLSELAILEARVGALKLDVLAEADRRQVADQTGDTGTDAWAAKLTGSTRGVMSGGIWLANLLRAKYDATREAFAAGGINQDQARVIVRAGEDLPAAVTREQRIAAEAGLVAKAVNGMNARRLRQAARRMLDKINRELADQHEAGQLKKEERRAENQTWMQLCDNGDGTFSGRFTIPELHGHLLRNYLERLTAPRRLARTKTGELVEDDTLPFGTQTLSWTEKLGAGFLELLEHLPSEGHGPVGATLLVNVDLKNLLDGLAVRQPRHRHPDLRRRGPPPGLRRRHRPGRPRRRLRASRPRPRETAAHQGPAACPVPQARLLRHRRMRTPLRLDRDPPPARLEPRRPHQPRQRPPPVRVPPPQSTRRQVHHAPTTLRRGQVPPEDIGVVGYAFFFLTFGGNVATKSRAFSTQAAACWGVYDDGSDT